MNWSARALTSADVDDVCAIFRRSRAAAMPWLPVLHSPAEDARFFASEIETSASWGADSAGVLLGFGLRRDRLLNHLYVDPPSWRIGVGGALLDLACAEGTVDLWVFEQNQAARHFYAAHGFAEVERTDGSGNEERAPDIRLRRLG
jgi:GNAT superfamily N-acetyltransferase